MSHLLGFLLFSAAVVALLWALSPIRRQSREDMHMDAEWLARQARREAREHPDTKA